MYLSFCAAIKDTKNIGRLTAAVRKHFDDATKTRSEEILSAIESHSQSTSTHLINKEQSANIIQAHLNSFTRDALTNILQLHGLPLDPQELEALEESLKDCHKQLHRNFLPLLAELEDKKEELQNQKKWVAFGFPEEALHRNSDCVQFVMQSAIGYSIQMFKNTTKRGLERHQIRFCGHEVYLNVNGSFEPWSKMKTFVEFDRIKKAIVLLADRTQTCNYISPQGLVIASRHPTELYPIEELDSSEQRELKSHAARFWQRHAEVDPGLEKECVLQIVTANKNCLPDTWYNESLNKLRPQHTAIRLIDKDGKVYSFGIDMTDEFKEYFKGNPLSFLATGYSRAVTPDFEETRAFDTRAITSIPLTEARMNAILQRVKETNAGDGMRFCMSKQNCNKFGVMLLDLAGIKVDTRTTFGEVLAYALPPLERVPVVGGPLWWLKNQIQHLVEPIFATINRFTPQPIKWVISFTIAVIFFVPGKIKTLFLNTIIIILGGNSEAQKIRPNRPTNESMKDHKIIHFASIITWWGDIFDDEKSECNHSYKLAQWQKEQQTTDIIRGSHELKMHILPQPVANN